MRWWLLVLLLPGCDVLFPEFAGTPPADLSGADLPGVDGGAMMVTGTVCALAEVGDPLRCSTLRGDGLIVSVEETREQAQVAADGSFRVTMPRTVQMVVAVSDRLGSYATTVAAVRPDPEKLLALPMVTRAQLTELALQNGIVSDERRGIVFAWPVDRNGAPLRVQLLPIQGAEGPVVAGGLAAWFNVPLPSAQLGIAGTMASVPVRPNALSMAIIVVDSR
jgi:hypothetical protein